MYVLDTLMQNHDDETMNGQLGNMRANLSDYDTLSIRQFYRWT
jgi:hypothetical protein